MDYRRQQNLLSPRKAEEAKILLIGAGSIGSATALNLSKMGIGEITVVDFDLVEEHNLPNQVYRKKDLGKMKVSALKSMLSEFADTKVKTKSEKFSKEMIDKETIIIVAVDNMATRREIFESQKLTPKILVDGRMGGEFFKVLTCEMLSPSGIERYEKTLHTDGEAAPLPCGQKAILYNIFGIASIISSLVKKHLEREPLPTSIFFDFKTFTTMVKGGIIG